MNAPSKVSDLKLSVKTNQKVLGLNVSVDDVFGMKICEGSSNLRHILWGWWLGKSGGVGGVTHQTALVLSKLADLYEFLVEFPSCCELKHQKYTLFVMEISINPQDVGMPVSHGVKWGRTVTNEDCTSDSAGSQSPFELGRGPHSPGYPFYKGS